MERARLVSEALRWGWLQGTVSDLADSRGGRELRPGSSLGPQWPGH